MCLINVCIKMENPGSRPITFNYTVAFFFSAKNITYRVSIDLYMKITINFFMQIYIIEYLLGTSQANEYRASEKKL